MTRYPFAMMVAGPPAPDQAQRRRARGQRLILTGCGGLIALVCTVLMVRTLQLVASGPDGTALFAQHFRHAAFLKQETLTNLAMPQPEHINPDGPAGAWRDVPLPYTGVTRTDIIPPEVHGHVMTAWYRFVVSPAMARGGGQGSDIGDVSFYLPRWKTEGRLALYQNGRLVWRSHGDLVWNAFNRPVLVDLPVSGPSVIVLRMDTMPGMGGGITQAWAGSHDTLVWRYRMRLTLQCIVPGVLAVVLLAMGIILFFVGLARPAGPLYLLFVFAAILYTVRIVHFMGPLDPALMPPAWFGWATVNSMDWLIVVGWLFCCGLAEVQFPLLRRILVWGMIACTLATTPLFNSSLAIAALALGAYIFCFVLSLPTMPLLLAAMWRRRSRSGILLLFWNMLMFPVAVHDMLIADYQISIDHIYLLPYVVPDLFLSCLYVLCRQYIGALLMAEQSNHVLETRLQAQELALRHNYDRLRQIEQRELLVTERQRLMRDMHDGLGSTLTDAIHMTSSAAPHTLIAQALRDCLNDLKLTVDSLEPVDADLLVLLANLRFRLTPRLEAQGMKLEWAVAPLPPLHWLTPSSALHILRILQEIITNIIKHAQAGHIRMSTATEGAGVTVRVEDNGKGFAPHRQANGGRGIENILWRTEQLCGRVEWQPGAAGTCFILWLPFLQVGGN